ncbi:MAG: tetraacyldisaccharide 4'-kinase [Gemmatimonadota bacterium]
MSVETGVRAARLGVALGNTWRFRDADDPHAAPRFRAEPCIYSCWHEYLLCFALLGRGKGFASLASRHADGEIISRTVSRLGFVMARGSSSRGGARGFRELLRAAAAGRSIYLTVDGPRGPRHVCQPGVVMLAARTGHCIVPMGMAATTGIRLSSWDRFLLPAPGSRIYVGFGEPIRVDSDEVDREAVIRRICAETRRQVMRCETLVAEAARGQVYGVRRVARGSAMSPSDRRPRLQTRVEARVEARIRRSWVRTSPPLDLRAASVAFTAARAGRHALYDTGVFESRQAPIPVVSIGGLTAGGSGKTPLASVVTGWLLAAGHRPAILTRGYPDELLLHRMLQPDAAVFGHPDRYALACRAAAAGATVAVLDDGFQHRRLARRVDLVILDRDALRRTNGGPLPAGPFRESIRRALRQADAIVLLGRESHTADVKAFEDDWLARHRIDVPLASGVIESGEARLVRSGNGTAPTVALTGIMKPNLFFDFVRDRCPAVGRMHALTDHGLPGKEWPAIVEEARDGGFVMTMKDVVRLEHMVPAGVAVWVVPERLVWRHGDDAVAALIAERVGRPVC